MRVEKDVFFSISLLQVALNFFQDGANNGGYCDAKLTGAPQTVSHLFAQTGCRIEANNRSNNIMPCSDPTDDLLEGSV